MSDSWSVRKSDQIQEPGVRTLKRLPAVGDWVYVDDGARQPYEVTLINGVTQKVYLSGRGWRHLTALFCVSKSQLQRLRVQRDNLVRAIAWLQQQSSG